MPGSDRTETSTSLIPVSLSPEEMIERFSVRARGGEHRAEGPAVTKESRFWRRASGSRVNEAGSGGRLVDAFDAAKILGAHCFVWQPESMLEHPEITQLGLADAADRIHDELRKLGWRGWGTREGRARYVELTAQLDELRQCADILLGAHADMLIIEAWRPRED